MAPDVLQHAALPFPRSLPEFQRLFSDDTACADYLEKIRWETGFTCPHCGTTGEPFRFKARPHVLRCRHCRSDIALTAGTVMEHTRMPLAMWFLAAYLVASHTAGLSAVQFQRQLGLNRYETAFQILHKLRAGMVRSDRDQIGAVGSHVEVDETWVGGATRGEGRGTHNQTLVIAAVEVRERPPKGGVKTTPRSQGRYAGLLRMEVAPNRGRLALTSFIQSAVLPGTMVITDAAPSYARLPELGYEHLPVVEGNLPIVHLVFRNLNAWLVGCHHGVSPKHLQAYLNEFTFRFNRRFYPFNSFRSLLGIGGTVAGPTLRRALRRRMGAPMGSPMILSSI